jgi:hypothetical protein
VSQYTTTHIQVDSSLFGYGQLLISTTLGTDSPLIIHRFKLLYFTIHTLTKVHCRCSKETTKPGKFFYSLWFRRFLFLTKLISTRLVVKFRLLCDLNVFEICRGVLVLRLGLTQVALKIVFVGLRGVSHVICVGQNHSIRSGRLNLLKRVLQ